MDFLLEMTPKPLLKGQGQERNQSHRSESAWVKEIKRLRRIGRCICDR